MTDTATVADGIAAWLQEIQVPHTHEPELDLTLIDDRASLANQARHDPLIEEVVERYVADMARGDRFPPIIVRRHPRGQKYIVLSGNHRVAAARATKTTLAGYVVECSDEIALRIAYEDNRRHGLPPSDAERVEQGIHLIALGWTQAAAAAAVGVSESKLQRARDTARFDERALRLGVTGTETIAPSSRSRMMGVRSDPAFKAMAQLVADAGLNGEIVQNLVTPVNAARSEAEALDVVEAERQRQLDRIQQRKAGKAPKRGQTPKSLLLASLTQISLLDLVDVVEAVLPEQRRDLSKRLNQAAVKLIEIDKALRR